MKELNKAISAAQSAANNEAKSSMGDKYETSRAMAHLEKEKYQIQMTEVLKLKKVLSLIERTSPSQTVQLGSLVVTEQTSFYISVPLGKVQIEDNDYFTISAGSPIGSKLLDKKAGDTFEFNGRSISIKSIY